MITRRAFTAAALAGLGVPRSRAGEDTVAVELVAAKAWVPVDGRLVELLTYNGQFPGPTLSIRPGQEVVIRLVNRLDAPTNLHFHGLHLAPNPGPDDSFLKVPAGEQHEYRFTLPAAHAEGTFWYHPHVHGSTAEQVGGGLAGAILVRAGIEEGAELGRVPEHTLLLQDFDVTPNGTLAIPAAMDRAQGREGDLITVSGQVRPALPLSAGGFLRLRILNASSSRFYNLRLEEHPLLLVGVDGGFLATPESRDTLLLSPGERADVIVAGSREPGEYRLLAMPYRRGMAMGMGTPGASLPVELAKVVYQPGGAMDWRVPGAWNAIEALPSARVVRRFVLGQAMGGMGMGAGMAMSFTINGRTFNEDRIDTSVRRGDVEDWEFLNPTTMDHPMHVHTNAFQVVGANGQVERAWKDTALVRAGQQVRVRTRFDDFAGLSVYHCHILDHEDLGMMGALRIS